MELLAAGARGIAQEGGTIAKVPALEPRALGLFARRGTAAASGTGRRLH